MKIISRTAVATVLFVASAVSTNAETLAPGTPAGVSQAQRIHVDPLLYFGVIAVGLGVAYAVTHDSNDNRAPNPSGTTSSTATTV